MENGSYHFVMIEATFLQFILLCIILD